MKLNFNRMKMLTACFVCTLVVTSNAFAQTRVLLRPGDSVGPGGKSLVAFTAPTPVSNQSLYQPAWTSFFIGQTRALGYFFGLGYVYVNIQSDGSTRVFDQNGRTLGIAATPFALNGFNISFIGGGMATYYFNAAPVLTNYSRLSGAAPTNWSVTLQMEGMSNISYYEF